MAAPGSLKEMLELGTIAKLKVTWGAQLGGPDLEHSAGSELWDGELEDKSVVIKVLLGEAQVVLKEVLLWQSSMGHRNICPLLGLADGCDYVGCVMPRAHCDLFQKLQETEGWLPEEPAKGLFRQMVSALGHVHRHCTVHLDVKAENFLVACEDGATILQLTDFGSAERLNPGEVGQWHPEKPYTLPYAGPEMLLNKQYDNRIDVWALGILLYVVLTGCFPYSPPDDLGRCPKSKAAFAAQVLVSTVDYEWVSPLAKETLGAMLAKSFRDRPTVEDLIAGAFLQDESERAASSTAKEDLPERPLDGIIESLQKEAVAAHVRVTDAEILPTLTEVPPSTLGLLDRSDEAECHHEVLDISDVSTAPTRDNSKENAWAPTEKKPRRASKKPQVATTPGASSCRGIAWTFSRSPRGLLELPQLDGRSVAAAPRLDGGRASGIAWSFSRASRGLLDKPLSHKEGGRMCLGPCSGGGGKAAPFPRREARRTQ